MSDLLTRLKRNQRAGSKPRCHWLTHGEAQAVADRLTCLVEPYGQISANDKWMPEGFDQTDEAEFHKAMHLLPESNSTQFCDWWFKIVRGHNQTSPSFDIASTCTIDGQKGLLLVEAKAHDRELIGEEKGKSLPKNPSEGQLINHNHIGEAIDWANETLTAGTAFNFTLRRDAHYQMSNRFASAVKLTQLGYPVILVYLCFLDAEEMRSSSRSPFAHLEEWSSLVKVHSGTLFPEELWNERWIVHGQTFIPLIRSVSTPHDKPCETLEFFS